MNGSRENDGQRDKVTPRNYIYMSTTLLSIESNFWNFWSVTAQDAMRQVFGRTSRARQTMQMQKKKNNLELNRNNDIHIKNTY